MIHDVAPGLWLWRQQHPSWSAGEDWDPVVTCLCVHAGGEVVLVDALLPEADDDPVAVRLAETPPTRALVLKPDHLRSADAIAARWSIPVHGPWLFWRDDVPATELVPLQPGETLPGGLVALHDPRRKMETPLWLPEHRTLVFADGLTAPEGELRIWHTPWHLTHVLPEMRALLDLPFERVVVSHGEPLHDRAAFEAALEREPWGTPTLA